MIDCAALAYRLLNLHAGMRGRARSLVARSFGRSAVCFRGQGFAAHGRRGHLAHTWPAPRAMATAQIADQGCAPPPSALGVGKLTPPSRSLWQLQRPTDNVVFEFLVGHGLLGRTHAAADRDTSRVHRL